MIILRFFDFTGMEVHTCVCKNIHEAQKVVALSFAHIGGAVEDPKLFWKNNDGRFTAQGTWISESKGKGVGLEVVTSVEKRR